MLNLNKNKLIPATEMLELNKNKLIPATEIIAYWGEIKGDISKQTDLVELTTDLDTSIKGWVESQGYVTEETLPEGIATESWVQSQGYLTEHQSLDGYATESWVSSQQFATQSWVSSQGYLTEHQDLTGYATENWVTNQGYITSIPDTFATKSWVESQGYLTSLSLNGYVQESNLKTINGESLVGKGDIVIQTTAENIECGPVSTGLFNFTNVNEGLIQITDSVEEINNTKENKKPVFYIDVDFDGPSVMTSYADYMSIGAQIKQLGADNVVLYVRDRSGYICMPDVIEVVSQNNMTITGMAYANNYRISNDSSSLFISFSSFVGYTQLNNNINDVKAWVVNQKYAKKTELKTINGESIVGSGDITIQATGGVTEEWLQNNLKTINGVSVVGPGDLFAPELVYLGIDLDSEELVGTYDEYKAVINKYLDNSEIIKLVVGFDSPSTGVWYDSYPSDVYSPTEDKVEIGGYFLDERDENNKRLIYYRIKDNDTAQKVEISFTPVPFDADIPDLTGYATETWVENKGYALQSEIPDMSGYALKSEIPSLTGYATQSWVTSQGYTTQTYVDNKIGQIDTLLDQMLG